MIERGQWYIASLGTIANAHCGPGVCYAHVHTYMYMHVHAKLNGTCYKVGYGV